ncbi:MAG: DUF3892 domain-containing protein [Pseudomonadota bacterium]
MAKSAQIRCIGTSAGDGPTDGATSRTITHVGGTDIDGTRWVKTRAKAIREIEAGERSFYMTRLGDAVWVVVATDADGNKVLRTDPDDDEPNHLLTLPDCP